MAKSAARDSKAHCPFIMARWHLSIAIVLVLSCTALAAQKEKKKAAVTHKVLLLMIVSFRIPSIDRL